MVKMQLWDCAGQPKFRPVINTYFKGSQGIILVYDITNESSFIAIKNWIEQIREKETNAIIVLVGQKCDLMNREVSEEKGKELAEELGIEFFEVSAKNDYNIQELFDYLIQQCIISATTGLADIGAI